VVCTAQDQCHDAGTCDTSNGACSNPNRANGSTCSDGNACTQIDTCQEGACAGSNEVVCTAQDQCHDAGTCNTSNGTCSTPVKLIGTACEDGDACTENDACDASGACASGTPVSVDDANRCTTDVCDPQTRISHEPDEGAPCSDDPCGGFKQCDGSGACVGEALPNGTPCPGSDDPCMPHACLQGACTAFSADGQPCDDNNACTTNDTCDGTGQCVGTAGGAGSCDDADACNGVETCNAGACIGGVPVAVDDNDPSTLDACDPATGAVLHTDCSAQLEPPPFRWTLGLC
jgi:hypothetical protein